MNSQTAANQRYRDSKRDIETHEHCLPSDLPHKLAMKDDLLLFLNTCLAERLTARFSDSHIKMIKEAERVVKTGGKFSIAMPRASGKSTIISGAVLWSLLCGHRKFVCLVASDAASSVSLMSNLQTSLETLPNLGRYYPEAIHYIIKMGGIRQRAGTQTLNGQPTRLVYKADTLQLAFVQMDEGAYEYCSGGRIDCRGITGRLRGIQTVDPTGNVIRPDLVLLDDVQTTESALSMSQVEQRMNIIFSDIHGLAGFKKEISIFSLATVISEGDVADQLLEKWRGIRVQMVDVFPPRQIVEQYIAIRNQSNLLADGSDNKWYLEHREEIEKSMKIYWHDRFNQNEISACQHALNLLADIGEIAFWSEYQNTPKRISTDIAPLTTADILNKRAVLENGHLPEETHVLVLATDINHYGLTWTLTATTYQAVSHVIEFGVWPGDRKLWSQEMNTSLQNAIVAGLNGLVEMILNKYPTLDLACVDGNYETETVYEWAKKHQFKCKVLTARGVSTEKFSLPNKNVLKKVGQECFLRNSQRGLSFIINSGWWVNKVQRGLLQENGTRGCVNINRGKNIHVLATQLAAEKLISINHSDKGLIYKFTQRPGDKNDYLDALKMSIAGASIMGAGDFIAHNEKSKRQTAPPRARGLTVSINN